MPHSKYAEFCKSLPYIPIYQNSWWLDAVAGKGNWSAVFAEEKGRVKAALPYVISKRYGFKSITQPPLTQFLGPVFTPQAGKYHRRLENEKRWTNDLIENLPKASCFSMNFSPQITNWLPWYWRGFTQTTRYSYELEDLSDLKVIYENFKGSVRTDIKKAQGSYGLAIKVGNIQDFISVTGETFRRKGIISPLSDNGIAQLVNEIKKHQAGEVFTALDSQGNVHAGALLVWDKKRAYYLMGGVNSHFMQSGAATFLQWHAIQFASTFVSSYDFEGSMIESIEKFFRSFGSKQISYFHISKVCSPFLLLARDIKRIMRRG